MTPGRLWVTAVVAATMAIGFAGMANAAWYAKFEGVDGSSKAPGHDKWIELQSFSLGLNPQSPPRGPGKVTVTKRQDTASPMLKDASGKGKVFATLPLDITASQGGTYLRYELKNVQITSYQLGTVGGVAMETMVIAYESIRYLP